MTIELRPVASRARERVVALAASVLGVSPHACHTDVPLAMAGLDSVAGLELLAAIEDEFGLSLPDDTLHEHDSLALLAAFVERQLDGGASAAAYTRPSRIARMRADAVLPADIVPSGPAPASAARLILLTGATGFLGAYLLRELMNQTSSRVVCLVRDGRGTGRPLERVRDNLERYALSTQGLAGRVTCIAGDLEQPSLGLPAGDYDTLSQSVTDIYHAGAAVDWVQPYEALRATNVVATREVLRLACNGPTKRVHLLSSQMACLSTRGAREVDEDVEPLADVEGLHLGYPESKAVAEALVRAAAERGVPVSITRPALVLGDSRTGMSNPADLLALFFSGCIRMRAAPDLDWSMDVVPVDHVAAAVVHWAGHAGRATHALHVTNRVPRHLRECVLWMRLRGYPVELLPYGEWLELLRQTATSRAHPLFPLVPFFAHRVRDEDRFLPELFQDSQRRTVRHDRSWTTLERAGLSCPAVDARLLDRCFDQYIARGVLPAPDRQPIAVHGASEPFDQRLARAVESALRAQHRDPTISVRRVDTTPIGGDGSIVAELTSWRRGTTAGLRSARIVTDGHGVADVVVKAKPSDHDVIDVGEHVARLCGRRLGDAYATWRDHLGFTRGHVREPAIYRLGGDSLRTYAPRLIASWCGDGEWVLVLERITDAVVSEAYDRPWSDGEIQTALAGLAEIHGEWYRRADELRAADWLPPARTARSVAAMSELWRAVSAHARPMFAGWAGDEMVAAQESLSSGIDRWWAAIEAQPQTLIHNDFNPRNVMLRGGRDNARLCLFDWELATVGAPQRDLAEFLSFALGPELAGSARQWVERYRLMFEGTARCGVSESDWDAGFRAALCDFALDRLAMYAMIHRIRPLRFLPRVVRSWFALHREFPWPRR